MYMQIELVRSFKALADETRLRILNLLLRGELCVCDIQFVLGASQPNISRHLTYLKNAGLVLDRREGTRIYYRLAEARSGAWRQLLPFLQSALPGEGSLAGDTRKLRKAMENGSCSVRDRQLPPAARERGTRARAE